MAGRILVVEDDAAIREILKEVLEEQGYSVTSASNGREALDALAQAVERPCLILLDLMMPVMDGRAFREEQLRRDAVKDIPVVVLSAYRDGAGDARAMHAAAFLRKPVRLADVSQIVAAQCGPPPSSH